MFFMQSIKWISSNVSYFKLIIYNFSFIWICSHVKYFPKGAESTSVRWSYLNPGSNIK